jgi:hypothetical protein
MRMIDKKMKLWFSATEIDPHGEKNHLKSLEGTKYQRKYTDKAKRQFETNNGYLPKSP